MRSSLSNYLPPAVTCVHGRFIGSERLAFTVDRIAIGQVGLVGLAHATGLGVGDRPPGRLARAFVPPGGPPPWLRTGGCRQPYHPIPAFSTACSCAPHLWELRSVTADFRQATRSLYYYNSMS